MSCDKCRHDHEHGSGCFEAHHHGHGHGGGFRIRPVHLIVAAACGFFVAFSTSAVVWIVVSDDDSGTTPPPIDDDGGMNQNRTGMVFLHQTGFRFVRSGSLEYEVINGDAEGLTWDGSYWSMDGKRFDDHCLKTGPGETCVFPSGDIHSGDRVSFKAGPGKTMRLHDDSGKILAYLITG